MNGLPQIEDIVNFSCNLVPEKTLLGAILERSLNDLFEMSERLIQSDAIDWFNNRLYPGAAGFTFEFVADIMELSSKRLDIIKHLVLEAQKIYDKRLQKGEAYRAGDSQLAEISGSCLGSPDAAAQWKRRVIRRVSAHRTASLAYRSESHRFTCTAKKSA